MTEAIFPLLGTAFIMLVLLPLCALIAKIGLLLLERDEVGGPLHGLNMRYVLLTSSSLLPLAWFLSAGLHQAETGRSALACLFDHGVAAPCFESGFFALALSLVAVGCAMPVLRNVRRVRPAYSIVAISLAERIEQIIEVHKELHALRGRILVTEEPDFALGTYGWLKPRVFVGLAFAARLSDEALASALGHENEHVHLLDPLRYLTVRLALAVNPLGRWLLEPHIARWYTAREAHCDREAVIRGSLPLPLADAIIQAARPSGREVVALGARDTAVLKFRIGMLLAFAERPPVRCCHRGLSAFSIAFSLLALVVLLPHQTNTVALDIIHTGAEQTLAYFWP